MDDKKKICEALVPVLQMTRDQKDLKELEYRVSPSGKETVTPYYVLKDGALYPGITVDVTADSGISMLRDILRSLG